MISRLDLVLIPLSIGSLLGVMTLVKWLGPRFGLPPEIQRKMVHVATGLYALTLPFTFNSRFAVILLLCMSVGVLAALRLPVFAKAGIASAVHSVERRSFGEIYLALAVGIIFWTSTDNLVLYVLPILVLTLSDAAAALAGTRYGSRHFQVEAGAKSWEGVTIFFLVTWILSLVVLLLMTDIDRTNVVVLSVMIAAFGALVEADSWGGLDNLFVPVGVHFLLASHAATPVWQLVVLACAFFLSLYAVIRMSPAFGITPHSARAYVSLIFLICAVTAPYNAMLPTLAVFAHLAARHFNPCRSTYPDLDLIAVSAGVALFWLFVGEFFGRNALNVYNLTFAAMAVIFVGVAVQHTRYPLRAATVAAAILLAVVALLHVSALNVSSGAWTGLFWPWVAAAIALAAFVVLVMPGWFDRYRSVRALGVGATVPLLLFVVKGLAG